jgi:hypothetical protein
VGQYLCPGLVDDLYYPALYVDGGVGVRQSTFEGLCKCRVWDNDLGQKNTFILGLSQS